MASLLSLLLLSVLLYGVFVQAQDAQTTPPTSDDPNASTTSPDPSASPSPAGGNGTSNGNSSSSSPSPNGDNNDDDNDDDDDYKDNDQNQQGSDQGQGANNGTSGGQDNQQGGQQGQQGQQQQNSTRIPLNQAKLPASAPIKQNPVTYRLQWKDSMDNGNNVIDYRIKYWQRDQNQSRAKSVRSIADFVDLKGLQPGEIYQAEVRARNELGQSAPLALTFKTQFVVNSSDVSQTCMTEIVDRTATSLLLDFFLQDNNKQDLEGFEVKYAPADQPMEYAATRLLDRYAPQFLITGLMPNTRYRFRVSTRLSGRTGQGQPCGEFDTIMPEVGAPLAPKAALGSTVTFQLQWEMPNNKSIKHYRLDYWADPRYGETPTKYHEIVQSPQKAFNLTALQPCQKYQVEISPRSRPERRQKGSQAPRTQQLPARIAHIMKLYFTTECTIVTGSIENPGFTL